MDTYGEAGCGQYQGCGVPGPLAGTRVVELSGRQPVRLAGLILAQLGADVALECSPLADAPDVESIESIIVLRWTDSRPGDASGHVRALQIRRPHAPVVVCEATDAFGGDDVAADDARTAEALAGLMWTLASYDGARPVYPVLPVASSGSGLLLAYSAVLGLMKAVVQGRMVTTRVTTVDGCMIGQVLAAPAEVSPDPGVPPVQLHPRGLATPLIRIYDCADGTVLFSAPSRDAWIRLAHALNIDDLVPLFPGAPWELTVQQSAAMVEALTDVFSARRCSDVLDRLTAVGVSAAIVGDLGDFAEDPQVVALGVIERAQDGGLRLGDVITTREESAPAVTPIRVRERSLRTEQTPEGYLPLRGVRVVELGTYVASPYAGSCLANFGADVIKIEAPPHGDPARETSLAFEQINQGKTSLLADLRQPGDLQLARELIGDADVFLTNLRASGLRRFGLDFEAVRAGHAPFVYCWVSGWGAGGPKSDLPGVDPVFQALSGLAVAWGGYSGRLRLLTSGFMDNFTGLLASVGIAAGLHRCATTGTHSYIEVSLLRTAAYCQLSQLEAGDEITSGTTR